MKMGEFIQTWEGSLTENKWNRVANIVLVGAILLLAILLINKDKIVIVQPANMQESGWVSKNQASRSYKESWGFALAQLTGNVTPGNVDFVKERLTPMLSPVIYNEVIDSLEMQAQAIKDDRITMRFEPLLVDYEEATDKVFVYGLSYVKGSTGSEERNERTYEYRFKFDNYSPLLVDLRTYEGKPQSEVVLANIQRIEERRGEAKP